MPRRSYCEGKPPHPVGHDHDGRRDDTDVEEVLALVVRPGLLAEIVELGQDLVLGEKDLLEVAPHVGGIHGDLLCRVLRVGALADAPGTAPIQADGRARG